MKNQRMADVPIGTSRSQAVRWHLSLLLSHHGSAHYPLADCGHTTDRLETRRRGGFVTVTQARVTQSTLTR